jgi:hypothetical protein
MIGESSIVCTMQNFARILYTYSDIVAVIGIGTLEVGTSRDTDIQGEGERSMEHLWAAESADCMSSQSRFEMFYVCSMVCSKFQLVPGCWTFVPLIHNVYMYIHM